MATRAAIIYLDPAQLEAISTYNHYDGYPENLGVALEKHYNDDFKANRIASEGYISYVDPETGNIDAKNQDDPDRLSITDDPEQTAMDLAELISSYGADYAYIWSAAKTEWHTIKNYGSRSTFEKLEQMMPELFGMGNMPDKDMMEGDYVTEWKTFLTEQSSPAAITISGDQMKQLHEKGAVMVKVIVQDKDGSNTREIQYPLSFLDYKKDIYLHHFDLDIQW